MGRFFIFFIAGATVGLSLLIGASWANAAGKGSGNASPGAPQGLALGNDTTSASLPSISQSPSDAALGSMLTTTPTIQPSGGSDDKVNVKGMILRLPF